MKKRKGILFIVSAPSGCGKTTICKNILKRISGVKRSVSVTTRRPRKGERDGKDYFFIPEKKFKDMAGKGMFLEWARNFGYYYGTPGKTVLRDIGKGADVILSIDVKGALQVRRKVPEGILIFITPPSLKELARRLKGRRTDRSSAISARLRTAEKEFKYIHRYDYAVLNDNLNNAVEKVVSIIKAERCKAKWLRSR